MTTLTRYTDVAGTTLAGTTGYGYDASDSLTAVTNKNASAATLSYYDYMLNGADLVTQESWQSENTSGGTISGTHTYAYDATNQLTAADGTVYTYDLNGNQTGAGDQTGSANRLTSDGTWTYTYDAEGNLTEKSKGSGLETWYYGYDTLNRLTSVERTSNGTALLLTATYTFDVLGHRMEEDDWQSGGMTTVTKTAYDGGTAWADLNGSLAVQTPLPCGAGRQRVAGQDRRERRGVAADGSAGVGARRGELGGDAGAGPRRVPGIRRRGVGHQRDGGRGAGVRRGAAGPEHGRGLFGHARGQHANASVAAGGARSSSEAATGTCDGWSATTRRMPRIQADCKKDGRLA